MWARLARMWSGCPVSRSGSPRLCLLIWTFLVIHLVSTFACVICISCCTLQTVFHVVFFWNKFIVVFFEINFLLYQCTTNMFTW
jgi:hypothetical protein